MTRPSATQPASTPLSSPQEVTLRRVAFGESDVRAMRTHDLAELKRRGLIEEGKDGPVLTGTGRQRFDALVMIGPSPRYLNDGDYVGGFDRPDIDGLLDALDSNYLGWSSSMAPAIMGRPDRPELGEELANSFCRTDPAIARQFARTTFLGDNRDDLARVPARTRTLVLQCADDVIAPKAVGQFVHSRVANSVLVNMRATGHCPNLSAPDETIAAIRAFLAS